jgi:hypothetical protein
MRNLKTTLYSLESAQEAKDMVSWPMGGQAVLPCLWALAMLKVPRETIAMPHTPRLTTNICHHILQEVGIDDDNFFTYHFPIIGLFIACIIFDSMTHNLSLCPMYFLFARCTKAFVLVDYKDRHSESQA